MTTKPKAKKFRIRRSAPLVGEAARRAPDGQQPAMGDQPFANSTDDGFGNTVFPTAATARPQGQAPTRAIDTDPETALASIRKEGLTGRQLRMARRVAQKHGLAPTSDFDAVRLLRLQGVDPFSRSNMLELVVPSGGRGQQTPNLPKTVQHQLPSTEVRTQDNRANELIKMQRDIVKRRRRKLLQLASRLAFFVLLPTLIAGWYFYKIATPMYATKTEFVIQQAQPGLGSASGGMASLFSGTSLATSQDSIAVQGYLQSLDAMLRLDADMGFRAHFSAPDIDPLQRLDPGATKEKAYKVYKKNVKISYDPTEGIIKMEVVAADPMISQQFSEHLLGYAEEQVDNLTQRLREDQMKGARESFESAEAKMLAAQQRVLELQERMGILDPVVESQAVMGQVSTFETQLQEKKLQLQQLLDNPRPNKARVDGVTGDIRRLENLIAELRSQLTETNSTSASLASVTGQLRLAETDLQTRQLMMTQALQQMETARIEANRQTRYLSTAVRPIAPDEPTYPRAFENTILAFLIFGGIYLMFSLTSAILREQVSG